VLSVEAGQHQVVIEKDRYSEVSQLVMVESGQVQDVRASLHLKSPPFSWRGGIGITSMILGAGALGVSVGYLRTLAKNNRSFTGDTYYNTIKTWTYVGYGVGGALLAAGIGLVVWEYNRDEVDSEDAIAGGSSGLPTFSFGTDGEGIYLGASARF
ncbi:MAG: PEGA domain-containing protein, partial [Deltaproteobacteria bacterium]|nr:PEGA domain-containing protein [Deltaproteobacteria bacterium]